MDRRVREATREVTRLVAIIDEERRAQLERTRAGDEWVAFVAWARVKKPYVAELIDDLALVMSSDDFQRRVDKDPGSAPELSRMIWALLCIDYRYAANVEAIADAHEEWIAEAVTQRPLPPEELTCRQSSG